MNPTPPPPPPPPPNLLRVKEAVPAHNLRLSSCVRVWGLGFKAAGSVVLGFLVLLFFFLVEGSVSPFPELDDYRLQCFIRWCPPQIACSKSGPNEP